LKREATEKTIEKKRITARSNNAGKKWKRSKNASAKKIRRHVTTYESPNLGQGGGRGFTGMDGERRQGEEEP